MIKVMSFNIRYGQALDGNNHWSHRKALALARIRSFDPDLLGLQECRDDSQADYVKAGLPDYQFYGVRREGGGDPALEMAPTLFKESAFRCLRRGHFWLSETPAVAGSKNWGSMFARTVTWVELEHKATGRSVMFANTHFDLEPAAIAESAKMLRGWIEGLGPACPVILAGDFNAGKDSPAYSLLAGDGSLRDAFRSAPDPKGDETTFHAFGQPDQFAAIDWILVSSHFRVAAAAIDSYREDSRYPSDHYPVTTVLDWAEEKTSVTGLNQ